MRLTETEYEEMRARIAGARRLPPVDTSAPPFKLPTNQAGAFALGRLKTGEMNKTEQQYAAYLAEQQHLRQVLWFKFEGIKLRLADNTFYTPDFFILRADCGLECREIKGFMMEDANVKIKVAASIYPFRFFVVRKQAKKNGGGWDTEEFS